jgi:hypothetical protein
MEQEEKTSFLNHAGKWGLINGAIGIFIFVVLYVVDYALMVNWKMAVVGLVLGLSIVSYASVDYRNSIGGYMSYGKAWQYGFVVFAISGIITVLFNILLYNVIDSELPQKLTDVALENQRSMMENFGAPPEAIDKAIDEAKARTENQFKIGGMAMGYGIQLVIYAVLSLITAIFGRRNPPMDQM